MKIEIIFAVYLKNEEQQIKILKWWETVEYEGDSYMKYLFESNLDDDSEYFCDLPVLQEGIYKGEFEPFVERVGEGLPSIYDEHYPYIKPIYPPVLQFSY